MKLKYAFAIGASLALTVACKPKLEAGTPEKGNMDPAKFVAIGGSQTAGFADGALYYEAQENSFVNLMAQQFKLAGGGDFKQPMMPYSSVGVGFTGKSRSVLGYKADCLGVTSLSPVPFDPAGGDNAALSANISAQGPFNNLGVPGMKMTHVDVSGYSNPFYTRMNAFPSTSVLQNAVAFGPTFYAFYLGEQDILEFAASGGTSGAMTPANGANGTGFDGTLNAAITTLANTGAKGVIGNVPDVTLYPFFNTVPYNGLKLDASNAALLNNALGAMGMSFQEGNNAFVIEDETLPLGARQMNPGELILLSIPLDSVKCHKMGTLIPIPDRYVLTLEEIAAIKTQLNAYNTIIATAAASNGLALADVNSFMKTVKTGTIFNGVSVNANFVSGGAFSLDGIQLNPMGHALLANVFIKSINQKFGSTIPRVDATKYRGVKFP